MNQPTLMAALNLVLAAALFWTCFCRQARSTERTTRPEIRRAFWLLSVAALCVGLSPWGHSMWPDIFQYRAITFVDLGLLGATLYVQAVTARYWRRGPPVQFHPEHKDHS